MDIDRTGDQDRCPRTPAGHPAQRRGSVSCGFRLPVAKLVLFAAALIAMGTAQALALPANHAYPAAHLVTDEEPLPAADCWFETIEEPSEPLIVDDLRTEGVTVAAGGTSPIHRKLDSGTQGGR